MFQTRRERTVMPLDRVVREVNTTLRGWVSYFHVRNCSKTLQLFFFNDAATTEIYPLSLHDALPI